jgi:hypothetical protein
VQGLGCDFVQAISGYGGNGFAHAEDIPVAQDFEVERRLAAGLRHGDQHTLPRPERGDEPDRRIFRTGSERRHDAVAVRLDCVMHDAVKLTEINALSRHRGKLSRMGGSGCQAKCSNGNVSAHHVAPDEFVRSGSSDGETMRLFRNRRNPPD